jgi:hypothetical protein
MFGLEECGEALESLGSQDGGDKLVLLDQAEIIIEETNDLFVRNLTEQAQACQQLEEIQVAIELVGERMVSFCRNGGDQFGVLRLRVIIEDAPNFLVSIAFEEFLVE